ncbi:MAG: CRISPR-associated protein Cas4 [bacterium]
MYAEDELVPLSALQHVLYCERQLAFIHLERVWCDNLATVRGTNFHERAHSGIREVRGERVSTFGVPVRSLVLGVSGVTDAVELTYADETLSTLVDVLPIEYKVGRPKSGLYDVVQVVAQAVCLEEMLGIQIERAYLYYGATRRRQIVEIDDEKRTRTAEAAGRVHEILHVGKTPAPIYVERKCTSCSFFDI